jgi:hypothetical protein
VPGFDLVDVFGVVGEVAEGAVLTVGDVGADERASVVGSGSIVTVRRRW